MEAHCRPRVGARWRGESAYRWLTPRIRTCARQRPHRFVIVAMLHPVFGAIVVQIGADGNGFY